MNRLYFGVASGALAIALGMSLWTATQTSARVRTIEQTVGNLALDLRARSQVAAYLSVPRYKQDRRFCGDPAAWPLCNSIALKEIPGLGMHSDLWVLMDAVVQVGKIPLAPPQAQIFRRLEWDLAASLSKYGAYEEAHRDEDLTDMIVASGLQDAVLALADLCKAKIVADCPGGIPFFLAIPLAEMSAFVADHAAEYKPYALKARLPSVVAVIESGLVPDRRGVRSRELEIADLD